MLTTKLLYRCPMPLLGHLILLGCQAFPLSPPSPHKLILQITLADAQQQNCNTYNTVYNLYKYITNILHKNMLKK